MVDNSTLPVDGGTEVFANEDIGGVKFPKPKLILGGTGVAVPAEGGAGNVSTAAIRTVEATNSTLNTAAAAINTILGTTSGAAVVTDTTGTIQQYLRGLIKLSVDGVAGEYETVAASQTTQTIGATGATGDYLEAVLIVPATVSPGNVLIKDGGNSAITIFTGGTNSVADLSPIYVALGLKSVAGAWQVTTGSNVSCIATGNFT